MNGERPGLRRREIRDDDLDGVVDLLLRGFPGRTRPFWERGLRRMGDRPGVAGCPRFGFLLDDGSRPVGVALMLSASDGEGRARCNLSSWTVDPAYRAHAPLLVASALKRRDVTYTNVSAAPHTWATIEAQGFRCAAEGQSVALPALSRAGARARVSDEPARWGGLPEAGLLDDHARYGCSCLTVASGGGLHPLVLLPVRARSGRWRLPLMRLVFCRDLSDLSRFAGAVGRWMLRRGALGLVVDGDLPEGLPGLRRVRRGRHYVKGPHPPRAGDLSYTERVIFGP